MYGWVILLIIMGQVGSSFAQEIKENITSSMDVMVFTRTINFYDTTGTVNPDNRIAQLQNDSGGLYFRPDIRYQSRGLSIWFKPRLNIDVNLDAFSSNEHMNNPVSTEKYEHEFSTQELKAKFQLGGEAYVLAGRYIKELGPSIIYNPSNPFVIETGQLNPKLEIRPMDFVELNVTINQEWEATLIANVGRADNAIYREPFFKFYRTYGFMLEYYGVYDSYSLLVSTNRKQQHHLALFGQRNISDSFLVWSDIVLDRGINRYYAQKIPGIDDALSQYDVINGPENYRSFPTALVGSSYTFEVGPTVTLEYFYTGRGFDDDEAKTLFDAIDFSSQKNAGTDKLLSNRNLARAINIGQPYLRKNYLFTQFGENDLYGILNYTLRYIHSFDDNSGQYSGILEWHASDSLEVFLVGIYNEGARRSDFGRLIDYQMMFGLIKRI
ncbi:MAG: hypothetical protein L3J89_05850 [Gammaproteobacteria bacterium]|nr:hypothetical protein [Gammaproteobacteria bacterium]